MPASAAVFSLSPLGDLRINGYDTDIPLLTLFEEPVKGSAARVNEKRRAGREELLAETIAFH